MVPYKRISLIVKAFRSTPGRKLKVIGDGTEMKRIRSLAADCPNIQLLGATSSDDLNRYLASARAFVFAAEEDFGILSVEAQACGTPVIALGRGGACETVIAEETGLFFEQATPQALQHALDRFGGCGVSGCREKVLEHATRVLTRPLP